MMIYLKSIFAGFVAVILTGVLSLVGFFVVFYGPPHGAVSGGEMGWDLRSWFATSALAWIVALVSFRLGFYWEFRRASRAANHS